MSSVICLLVVQLSLRPATSDRSHIFCLTVPATVLPETVLNKKLWNRAVYINYWKVGHLVWTWRLKERQNLELIFSVGETISLSANEFKPVHCLTQGIRSSAKYTEEAAGYWMWRHECRCQHLKKKTFNKETNTLNKFVRLWSDPFGENYFITTKQI